MIEVREIQWEVDAEDMLSQLEAMPDIKAANLLGISVERYKALSDKKKEDLVVSYFKNNLKALADFMDLPYNITIPEEISAANIDNWLSDTFGFCHRGHCVVEK